MMANKAFDKCFNDLLKQKKIRSKERTEVLRDEYDSATTRIIESDPSLTDAEIMLKASQEVSDKMRRVELKKIERTMLKADAERRIEKTIADNPKFSANEVIEAQLMSEHGLKMNVETVEQGSRGLVRSTKSVMDPLHRLLGDKLNLYENGQSVADFADSIYGVGKNADMNKAVAGMQDMFENMRLRLNKLGADIPKLDSWRSVQRWSSDHAERAYMRHADAQLDTFKGLKKNDKNKAKRQMSEDVFVKDWMGWIDYDLARNKDGAVRTPAEMDSFLRKSFESIYYEPPKTKADVISITSATNEFSRQLHIKDSASWREAMALWGQGSVFDQTKSAVERMAMNIKMFEKFGPTPVETIKKMTKEGATAAQSSGLVKDTYTKATNAGVRAIKKAEWMLGDVEVAPKPGKFLQFIEGYSNLQMMKLGSAAITSVTDAPFMHLAAAVNKSWGATKFVDGLKRLNPKNADDIAMLEAASLMSETAGGHLYAQNKGIVDSGWTRFAGEMTIRLSGLAHITDVRRATLAAGLSNGLGRKLKTYAKFSDFSGTDKRILESRGITDADWLELQKATIGYTTGKGKSYPNLLIPDSIQNPQLREKVLGFLSEEVNLGVLEPGMRERFWMSGEGAKGSKTQIFTRTLLMFKSFPISMMSKHFARARGLGGAAGTGYAAAAMIGTTVFGGIALQANELLSGKDTRDMTDPKFIMASFLKGGALGIYGDALFSSDKQIGSMLFGPAIGDAITMAGVLNRPLQSLKSGDELKEDRMGGDAIKVARSYIPGSTLWWAKGVVDRMLIGQMQEAINPGYIDRQALKQRRDYGNEYWWARDELTPDRAPDILGGE